MLAVGSGLSLALQLVAKGAGAEVFLLLLADAAVRRGRRAKVFWVFYPVAPKLGQDDQRVWAALLKDLQGHEGSGRRGVCMWGAELTVPCLTPLLQQTPALTSPAPL